MRMEIGFPANGRTVNARELEKILFGYLPECVKDALFFRSLDARSIGAAADLAEDQQYIRQHLKEMGLVAFVADGSILPRESGISGKPMKRATAFVSPKELAVTMELPHAGSHHRYGNQRSVTIDRGWMATTEIHPCSKALELGVYNHIRGDGESM